MTDLTHYRKEIDAEYSSYRSKLMQMTPAERAKRLTVPEMVWQAHTGQKKLPDDMVEEVIKRQTAFLEEHPHLTIANPICYRDLMEPRGGVDISVWHDGLMRLVEAIVGADKREASNVIKIKV